MGEAAAGPGGRGGRRPVPLAAGPEFDLVRSLIEAAGAPAADPPLPIGGDAAVLDLPAGRRLAVSVDASVEDVHFRRAWMTWEAVGYRATAAALSDLAAVAAVPVGVLATVLLPPELDRDVATAMARGIGACLRRHGGALLGGDVSRSPGPVALDIVAVGHVGRPVGRGGARPGDELWVTGELGGAASAVADLSRALEPDPRARRALERPVPRLEEAGWLRERADLHAMIDLSDGLAGDAAHVAAASGVRLEVTASAVPVARALRDWPRQDVARRLALAGGEDYELLVAAPPGALGPLAERFEDAFAVPLTRVGRVVEGEGVGWVEEDGSPAPPVGGAWDHFGGGGGAGGRGGAAGRGGA